MYTRCPSCRSEISFEPPANLNNLPEGYKHRIRCPNCGVTIGVKIPRQESYLQAQPTFTPANPNAANFEPVYNAGVAQAYDPGAESVAGTKIKPPKKKGRGRNAFMLIVSLLFIALSVVGYLIIKGTIPVSAEMSWLDSFRYLDGITAWERLITDFAAFSALFSNVSLGMTYILPMLLFTLAGINALVSLISLIGGKYGRAYNIVMGVLMALIAACCMFRGFFLSLPGIELIPPYSSVMEYLKMLADKQRYVIFAVAGLGVVQLLFSLIFIKSLVKKPKAV